MHCWKFFAIRYVVSFGWQLRQLSCPVPFCTVHFLSFLFCLALLLCWLVQPAQASEEDPALASSSNCLQFAQLCWKWHCRRFWTWLSSGWHAGTILTCKFRQSRSWNTDFRSKRTGWSQWWHRYRGRCWREQVQSRFEWPGLGCFYSDWGG